MEQSRIPNRLIREQSPYLLQHAYNPVDWYPWGEEAFERAASEHKPIFLSIGYSTCYWCHVMEREVFENTRIASLMNAGLVCIKVDREELPNVDRVYMAAAQAMTGSGGWPLSAFLTPELKPFYIGTYIPPRAQFGKPGFVEVLEQIRAVWEKSPEKILATGDEVYAYLKNTLTPAKHATPVTTKILDAGFASFVQSYDATHAGFGAGTKFPRPVALNFLFRYYARTANPQALGMAYETLRHIAAGGIRDFIGGGFHRYSTDSQWRVPHFEKMLYDQAQLAISFIESFQLTQAAWCRDAARETLDYVKRVLTSPEGGFYSAEDAESAMDQTIPDDKEEGKFYVWRADEMEHVLGADTAAIVNYHYGVLPEGNALFDPHNVFVEKNILYEAHSIVETATHCVRTPEDTASILEAARASLFAARERRPKPDRDDKVIVSWNGLMISAFARATQAFGGGDDCRMAERAAEFVLGNLWDESTRRLLHRWRAGESRFEANLEDYAFLVQGLLDMYEASFDGRWLQYAKTLTERQLELFYDAANGGFYDAPESDTHLLIRSKEIYDGAEPTGNAVAIINLLRLSVITANGSWRDIAERSLDCFASEMASHPQAMAQFLVALDWRLSAPQELVIAGSVGEPETLALVREIRAHFLPHTIVLMADGRSHDTIGKWLPFTGAMTRIGGAPAVYRCQNFACQEPITGVRELHAALGKGK